MYAKVNQGENADEIILCSTSQSILEYCVRDTLQLSMSQFLTYVSAQHVSDRFNSVIHTLNLVSIEGLCKLMKRWKMIKDRTSEHTNPLRINSSTALATPSSSPVQNTYCAMSNAEYWPPLCLNSNSAFYIETKPQRKKIIQKPYFE